MNKNDEQNQSGTTIRSLVTTLIYTTEAMINILERNQILSRSEIIEEIRSMREAAESQRSALDDD
ncbi:MAG: hypothetical protein JRG97_01665 [Deltaproteobacteria bacterium]|nr:hypothetical protein [Deltaproteobacteria bacterium]MBW2052306.1 hypothetical protein [Deltaproteobacteria bacterium]MBW2139762.1 hypothetical protein [Deltaproteobacteria bacterium]MBW2323007.1 hypothetical protein [Deltaproteobacteria bacterium]